MKTNKTPKSVIENFSLRYCSFVEAAIKEQLYLESPLRNQFQIRPISDGELPIFPINKTAYIIDEKGSTLLAISESKRVAVPFFELQCDVRFPYDLIIKLNKGATNFPVIKEAIIKKFLSKASILNKEKKIFKKLEKYLPKSQRRIFAIRTDLTSLISSEGQSIGFSFFEQVGAVVIS